MSKPKYNLFFHRLNIINFNKINFSIAWLFLSALILRLFLANFGTLQLDHGTFVAWANSLSEHGFKSFYSGWSDYLPGYLYVLFILGKINNTLPFLQTLTFKLPAILADLFTGLIIHRIVIDQREFSSSRLKRDGWVLGLFALYVFNPAVLANSTLWGQVDSLTAFFSLASIYLASKDKLVFSSVLLALGTLVKPQAAFVAPAIFYLVIINKWKAKQIVCYLATGLLVFILGFLPFTKLTNIFSFVFERLLLSANQYPYGSVNAFSFWGLFGFWKPDPVTSWIGIGLTSALVFYIFIKLIRRKNSEYLIASLSLLITFLFLTRMHERHLLPVLAPLLVSSVQVFPSLLVYGALSFTYIANLAYAYYWITDNFKQIYNPVIIGGLVIVNLISLFIFIKSVLSKKAEKLLSAPLQALLQARDKFKLVGNNKKLFLENDIPDKKAKKFLIAILAFSLLTRFWGLANPQREYFDEVYHAFTAKLMLHGDPKAWEWWNPHPEGFAYEWTHPPVAKMGMVVGMKIFGENAFGFRSIQAFLGVLSVLLVYLIVINIFNDRKMALLSAFLLSTEGLFLVMNRIGMNDTFLVFFLLLSYFFFIKDKNILSAISFGLAISSKWSAVYFLPVLGITHLVLGKKINLGYLWFLVLTPIIYVATYTQMFTTGHDWGQFVEVQRQMWWYHTNLDAQHPYTSPAWSWPLLIRPIYLYNGPEIGGFVERIYAFGNPAIFWFGLYSFVLTVLISWKEKIKKLGLIIFSYLIFFVPWLASPRIMFLYHYLPSIPFLAILSGFTLRRFPKLIIPVLTVATLVFVYFYPHWSAVKIPEALDASYYWFSSWR